ncbi:hypothetical protein CSA37_02460 [Candidatus Fermentibacteria bacterium]|nr:MAG: hypothetical protein CSA37_02460 [Candidatus Fermentibacteria bacterium]
MEILNIAGAEARMMLWSMKRYMFNTLSMIGVLFLIFMGMFWGIKTIGGQSVSGDSLDSMLVGYVLWVSAMMALQGTGSDVMNESQRGTLEQLYLSPAGAHAVFFVRALAGILFNLVMITVMLYLTMLTTGRWLSVNLPFLYSMVILSTLPLIGISFMLGGIGLIHKRTGAVNSILSFGLIGLMLLPTYPLTPYSFLPFIAGASVINGVTVRGESFPLWWYLFIAGNGLFYLMVGLSVFKVLEKKAKQLNKLGQY